MHVLYLGVVSLQLTKDHLLVFTIGELSLDHLEVVDNLGQFVRVSLLSAGLLEQFLSLVTQLVDFVVEHIEHWLQVSVI